MKLDKKLQSNGIRYTCKCKHKANMTLMREKKIGCFGKFWCDAIKKDKLNDDDFVQILLWLHIFWKPVMIFGHIQFYYWLSGHSCYVFES